MADENGPQVDTGKLGEMIEKVLNERLSRLEEQMENLERKSDRNHKDARERDIKARQEGATASQRIGSLELRLTKMEGDIYGDSTFDVGRPSIMEALRLLKLQQETAQNVQQQQLTAVQAALGENTTTINRLSHKVDDVLIWQTAAQAASDRRRELVARVFNRGGLLIQNGIVRIIITLILAAAGIFGLNEVFGILGG
jgi:hypothetical protein